MACATCDVSGDGVVAPQDVLIVVNALNDGAEYSETLDVNSDGYLTPIDALVVINYLNDQIKPDPKHKIRYMIRDTDVYSFTDQQIRDTLFATFDEFESRFDMEFVQVSQPPYQFVFTTAELWSGHANIHYGGLFNYDTNELFIHNFQYGPYRHSGMRGPIDQWLYWVPRNLQGIQQVIGHEIGHSFGLDHSNDTSCRMHSNAPPGFCQQEINWFNARFGVSQSIASLTS